MRLDPQPGEVIDRSAPMWFRWNGRPFPAYDGDTIASALAACGERVFSRSFKYHRPRGLLTASHLDPGCLVQVGDEPNVRGAHRRVQPGMDVSAQDVWPSLGFDVKAANELVRRAIPAGFYYKTFIRPQRLWPAYERVLERFAHGGSVPDPSDLDDPTVFDHRHAHPDVLVAGGGPAGMAAALAAAHGGARVMLAEQEAELGGHLRWGGPDALARLAALRTQLAASDVEVLLDSTVLGRYDDNLVSIAQHGVPGVDERLVKARVGTLVVAAGLIERPYVFAGNDVPGVMLSTAVRRLVNLYAVRPGDRAVVLTANPDGDAAAADLRRVGVDVVHVEDARRGGDVVRVLGRSRVTGVEFGDGTRVDCDLLVTATGWTAPVDLLTMAGHQPAYDEGSARFVPLITGARDVMATGGLVGDGSLDELVAHGRAVGEAAAGRSRDGGDPSLPPLRPLPHPALFAGRTHGIVDFSEDVSSKDIALAVEEGYGDVELVKRYTTATMGPDQGKLGLVNTVALVAAATGQTISETGTTTWRPPYVPVTLGALAGRPREPVRVSALHDWHGAHGAVPLVAGAWLRPDHYGDPAGEARAVRTSVGIIDVTPIGKLDLRGPDVPLLLNHVYVNAWSKLGVGRVRYGVMCGEDGVVLDDGVTGRLGDEHFLMSTTSSGAATVWEWLESWLQTEHPDWRVHVTPVTTAYTSINIAGPRSRTLLSRLVDDIDVDPDAFPYMHVRTGSVAGVAGCVGWRIGFTGELSFELHVPAGFGLHVWEALMAAGADLGVRPFGVEAQRILRLEKGHLIVGQDTDGLTTAAGAGLDSLVRTAKADSVGLPELATPPADGTRLVALVTDDPTLVPTEGGQLLRDDGRICGRVTSSRLSPTLERSVCLAQLDVDLASAGQAVAIRLVDGTTAGAQVAEQLAQVDPEGARLHG
jgi:sarcosine oxidase, subunit alpha